MNEIETDSPLWVEAKRLCTRKHHLSTSPCKHCVAETWETHTEDLAAIVYDVDEGD